MTLDFDKLRVPADKKIKVTPILSTITVGKPHKSAFFRIRYGEGFEPVELYTYAPHGASKDSMPYLVMPDCQSFLQEIDLLIPAKFYLYQILYTGVMKVDFISQKTDKSGNRSRYHETREAAYEAAKTQWVQMRSNQDEGAGYYTWSLAKANHAEPVWPQKPATILEAIEIAFKNYILDSMEHPEIKKLLGQAI